MYIGGENALLSGIVADMHTHSENSHDSECAVEDMCLSQICKGTKIMAVTDHCDIFRYKERDIFKPILTSYNTVKELNQKYKDKCLLLSGVEIGEGFWHPDVCKEIIDFLPYDVILGSVHCTRYKKFANPYSVIDFSSFAKEDIERYLSTYFDDMITMINSLDIDILAHLTCPIRYICGKYGKQVDMSLFEEKIETILSLIIKNEIALEINTSSYDLLNDFMPSERILKRFYDMGGYLITLGSDAHKKDDASKNFDDAIKIIKDIGYKSIFYYQNRKPHEITLV